MVRNLESRFKDFLTMSICIGNAVIAFYWAYNSLRHFTSMLRKWYVLKID